MDEHDNSRALSGEVRISYNGFGFASTIYTWPIASHGYNTPAVNLILRHRDDGEIFLSLSEDWSEAFDD